MLSWRGPSNGCRDGRVSLAAVEDDPVAFEAVLVAVRLFLTDGSTFMG